MEYVLHIISLFLEAYFTNSVDAFFIRSAGWFGQTPLNNFFLVSEAQFDLGKSVIDKEVVEKVSCIYSFTIVYIESVLD